MKATHRFWFVGGLVFVFAISAIAQVALPLGDAQRSRVFATRSIDAAPHHLLWQMDKLFRLRFSQSFVSHNGPFTIAGDIPTGHNYTLPLVSGGVVFFTVYVGNAYFYAVDAAAGKPLVMLKFDDTDLSTLAAMGQTAFFGTAKGRMIAYEVSTRTLKWAFEQKDASFAGGSPVIADGVLYICGRDTGVYALAADTGALLWQFKSNKPLSGPAVQGEDVIVLSDTALIALDKKTGSKKWESSVGRDFYGPSILDDQIFVRHVAGEIRAYALADGSLRWKSKKQGGTSTPITLFSGRVIYGEKLGNVVALDARTAAEKWRFTTKARCRNPMIAGTTVYTHCDDHYFYALDSLTGLPKWSVDTKRNAYTPVIAGGVIYALSSDGVLQAIQ